MKLLDVMSCWLCGFTVLSELEWTNDIDIHVVVCRCQKVGVKRCLDRVTAQRRLDCTRWVGTAAPAPPALRPLPATGTPVTQSGRLLLLLPGLLFIRHVHVVQHSLDDGTLLIYCY